METTAKVYRYRVKVEVLTHYGGGKLACVKCGFSDVRALCLDHLNSEDKKGEDYRPSVLRARLKREGFPEGYQTLCANCNLIKAVENGENTRTTGFSARTPNLA